MSNNTTPGFAGNCGQSSDSADNLRTEPAPKPRSIIVNFSNVGRNKRSWSKTFPQGVTTGHIAREAKRNGGLMSSEVDAELNDGGSMGHIIVGGWRVVGTFTITPA
jgi:hypothetical protein